MKEIDTIDEIDNIDSNTQDEGMLHTDLEQLNVNVWFNKLESRLQNCLTKDDVKGGFTQYRILVLHAEILAIASKKIKEDDFLKEVKAIHEKNLDKYEDESIQLMRKSMIKYRVILEQLLKQKKSDMNLTY